MLNEIFATYDREKERWNCPACCKSVLARVTNNGTSLALPSDYIRQKETGVYIRPSKLQGRFTGPSHTARHSRQLAPRAEAELAQFRAERGLPAQPTKINQPPLGGPCILSGNIFPLTVMCPNEQCKCKSQIPSFRS
jgi:hypothetical protein